MTAPVVVMGGGLAGATAATLLAQAGRRVVVFEREAEPVDKMCGEFISAEAMGYFARIGLNVAALGGHAIDHFRLVRGNRVACCKLPFSGLGLSRRVLDEALLRHGARCGAEIRRGRKLQFLGTHDEIDLCVDGREKFSAGTVFLATGKHDAHRLRRRVAAVPDLIGLKLHLRLSPAQESALTGHVEIILLRTGYAGLQLVENGIANLCLLVSRAQFAESGGTLARLFESLRRQEPHLAERLAGSCSLFSHPLSIAGVPYGFVHVPRPDDPKHVFRLGDQMGVIPSFTGDGMSIALHSSFVAVSSFLAGCSAEEYHRRMRGDVARQIRRADVLYRMSTSSAARGMLMFLARMFPGSLRAGARMTRVSPRALSRIGQAFPEMEYRA